MTTARPKTCSKRSALERHGEALDGGIGEAGQAQAEFSGFAADLDLGNALGVGAFEGVGDAEEGGELADADAVVGGEGGVARVIEHRPGVAVVAGDERDDGDVEPVEPEDLGVEDEVFRVFVVGAGADVGADLVEDGGHLEQQRVVLRELVEVGEFVEEPGAQAADVLAVARDPIDSARRGCGRSAAPPRRRRR